jgi:hypothetical protein
MNAPRERIFNLACMLTLVWALGGCATSTSSSGAITAHVSRPITSAPNTTLGDPQSALYTYVLATNRESISEAGSRARVALAALLVETQPIPVKTGTQPPGMPIRHLNQFLIPAKVPLKNLVVSVDEFDLTLSEEYLALFRLALIDSPEFMKRLQNRGPFLLASRQPIGQIVKLPPKSSAASPSFLVSESPILIVDMTNYPERSIPIVVQEYKKTVANLPEHTAVISSMRAWLAAKAVDLNIGIETVISAKSKVSRELAGQPTPAQ